MTTVHLSEDLGQRLAAEAARRGMSVDEVAGEALAARYPEAASDPGYDAMEALIGSGSSGQHEAFDTHQARSDLARRRRDEDA